MNNSNQSETNLKQAPGIKPKKKNKIGVLITTLAGALLIGGGAFAYKTFVYDNQPDNILQAALTKDYSEKKNTVRVSYKIKDQTMSKEAKELTKMFGPIEFSTQNQKDKRLMTGAMTIFAANGKDKLFGFDYISDQKNKNDYFKINLSSKNLNKLIDHTLAVSDETNPKYEESLKQVEQFKPQIIELSNILNGKWYKSKNSKENKNKLSELNPLTECYNQKNIEEFSEEIRTAFESDKNLIKQLEFKKEDSSYEETVFVLKKNGNQILEIGQNINDRIEDTIKSTKLMKCIAKKESGQESILSAEENANNELSSQQKKELENIDLKIKLFINKQKELSKEEIKMTSEKLDMMINITQSEPTKATIPKKTESTKKLEQEIQKMIMKAMFGDQFSQEMIDQLDSSSFQFN